MVTARNKYPIKTGYYSSCERLSTCGLSLFLESLIVQQLLWYTQRSVVETSPLGRYLSAGGHGIMGMDQSILEQATLITKSLAEKLA
jgi:hypothetical protein